MDPPRHNRVRALVSQAFSPKRLNAFKPTLIKIVDDLLDSLTDAGKMDIITNFAYPIPQTVIAELLGIPVHDRKLFQNWAAAFVVDEVSARQLPVVPEMDAYFRDLIERRRDHPQNDIITTLVHAQVDREALTPDEILGFCELLLLAGYETTAHLIGNLFRCFDEHPEVQALVWSNPQLVPAVVEETLRYLSPVSIQIRFATRDIELQGQQIRKGQVVIAWINAANRDERQFASPNHFDIHRSPNQHIAFGFRGIHFCLGAPLARLEATVALSRICQRLSNIQRDRSVPLEAIFMNMSGVKHFPVTFQAK